MINVFDLVVSVVSVDCDAFVSELVGEPAPPPMGVVVPAVDPNVCATEWLDVSIGNSIISIEVALIGGGLAAVYLPLPYNKSYAPLRLSTSSPWPPGTQR